MRKLVRLMKNICCQQIKRNLKSKLLFLAVLLIIPVHIIALNNNTQCDRFHIGTFIYESKFGKIIIVRSEKEEIDYRVYPNHYIRQSVKWVSSCKAELEYLEINDPIIPADNMIKSSNNKGYLYILETYPDGYSYKTTDNNTGKHNFGKVKIYKGPL
ncbi:hypothetical protein EHQ16_02815 [Leptospira kanakyensis]|uniref:Uncharacterized protein n=1 Tax=Leptospira kanakyensis TaxID=2484968 RepID=A0A6N4PUT4_9LEPT|nr:hypothetical protein [Leptospira kanakyensis]TGK47592.1 hypothetical protein EHQ11_16815 [Leptospira kanakyensis]TGK63404.1 hypothetical protein EHQ16_02815 [Leptospira kanakyensis]TGK67008.1 hypothetical protein EHQ18_18050 [Leptospira kanakyensis]